MEKKQTNRMYTIGQAQINEAHTHTQFIFLSHQRGFEVQINLPPNSFSTGLSLNI